MALVEIHHWLTQRDEKVGDLIYRNHELLRVTAIGRWRKDHKRVANTRSVKFRVIGKVNLDKQFRPVARGSAPQ
jgi:hypothetical protein